jgi:hypothetical protein
MGEAFSIYGDEFIYDILRNSKEREHWEDQSVGWWIILRWILERGWGDVEWNEPIQNKDQWQYLRKSLAPWS